jgi:hypothetical protein
MNSEVLLQQTREALDEVGRQLRANNLKQKDEKYSTLDLMAIQDELKRIETEITTSTIPKKNNRISAIGRIVTDGWDCVSDPLAIKLVGIGDSYKRKLE